MKKIIILLLLVLLSANLFSQHLFTERSVRRGEILNAYVYPSDNIRESRFTLLNNKGRIIADSNGFTLDVGDAVIEISLLGIPSDLAPGKYTLKVFCETEEGSDQFIKPFFISDRGYLSEEITLNSSMSDLRSNDDPRKAEQSRQLWSVISTFDEDSQYYRDEFDDPVKTYIESAFFGDRRSFLYSDGSSNLSLHNGADFAAPTGEPVYSAGDGKVVMVEDRIITGNTVIIEHLPGVFTLYYHMDSISIEQGMIVSKGMEIGKVGATGLVTGAHLHWELRVSTVAVDPLLYVQKPLINKTEIINIINSIE